LNSKGIFVPTGFFTYVAVDRQFIEKKPKPYSDCTSAIKRNKKKLKNKN
jgi:predicted aspartyl protease